MSNKHKNVAVVMVGRNRVIYTILEWRFTGFVFIQKSFELFSFISTESIHLIIRKRATESILIKIQIKKNLRGLANDLTPSAYLIWDADKPSDHSVNFVTHFVINDEGMVLGFCLSRINCPHCNQRTPFTSTISQYNLPSFPIWIARTKYLRTVDL